ncbi:hypothetical protein HJD18_10490 [Thermoleophilia bacterium SCSIO 60948]|nr:hypothetical protein HJD18_10490 [Thermoleophilia bacterium SCSIO 60948]
MAAAEPSGAERRYPSYARWEIDADPKRVRAVLGEIERSLAGIDAPVRRRVTLLVGELIGRAAEPEIDADQLRMEIHERPGSLRLDIWDERGRLGEDFWTRLADSALVGLASSWGLDRRRASGAWFEVVHPQEGRSPRA